jgi:adenylate cyclase
MTMMAIGPLKRQRYDYSKFAGHHAPHVCCLSRSALSLWLSGFLDQARDASRAGVQLAEDLDCVHSLAHAYAYAAFTSVLAREPEQALSYAQRAVSIATKAGLPQCLTMAEVLRSIAESHMAPREGAVELVERAIQKWKAVGIKILSTFWHAQAAEICLAVGHFRKGLQHIKVGLETTQKTGERFYSPELYRLKGELLLAESPDASEAAEPCFYKAVEQAQELDARLLNLRALMSLNRFQQTHGRGQKKRREAQRNLKQLHKSFAQGLDTPDLRTVQAFLSQTS